LYESLGCLGDCITDYFSLVIDCSLMKICIKKGQVELVEGWMVAGEVATARAISAADTIMVFVQILHLLAFMRTCMQDP
jgi:hypothetical protein